MGAQPRLGGQRGVHRRALEADQIDVTVIDGQGKRVVLHSRTATQIPEHDHRSTHVTVYLALILAGCVLGLLLTPLVTSASTALGLVDAPGGRKVHSLSVPRVGGLVVIAAALLAGTIVINSPLGSGHPPLGPLAPMLLGAALVFAVGIYDDVRPCQPGSSWRCRCSPPPSP